MHSLRSFNLNLMPVLRELLRKRNVTHAARALNMSQPAVSEALGRLRVVFRDELLVPEGRSFRPTMLAQRIEHIVEDSLAQIEDLVCEFEFEPARARGEIRIGTADYVVLLLGNALHRAVSEAAPQLTIQFVDLHRGSADDLVSGSLDFILSPNTAMTDSFERQLLFEDSAVCLVADSSPYDRTLREEDFWASRHASFSPGDNVSLSFHSTILHAMGRDEFNGILVQSFLLLPFMVEDSALMALVPTRLADRLVPLARVRAISLPFAFPPVRINSIWDRSRKHDPLHDWFRQLMLDTARRLFPGEQ